MNIIGKLPIRPHLKKFVLWLENVPTGKPVALGANTSVGLMFQSLLCQKSQMRSDYSVPADYSDILEFETSRRNFAEGRMFMSNWSVVKFNQFLHHQMHLVLLERILTAVPLGKHEVEVIYDFLRELDIEEDIGFEAVEKASRRLRSRTRAVKFVRGPGRF
jgi:hypothetical protein